MRERDQLWLAFFIRWIGISLLALFVTWQYNNNNRKKCNGEGHVMERGLVECSECGGSGIPGRSVIFGDKDKQIDLSLQDDERTLKITITKRGK